MKTHDTALYRKYRPQTFDEVLGQEHVVDILKREVKEKSVSHAYLFAGSRGTGKTSVARILAREIGASPTDVYEIDAASNRGIDDVRALREAVATMPYESPYKVYIIDEVHMLTKEAFNALLKTLEEPPSYAVFVLATTEPEKLPDTVISRCEIYHFNKPARDALAEMIKEVGEKEGVAIEPEAAMLVATLGDGSYRDTLGMLQKVLASTKAKKIAVEDVEQITGAPRSELLMDLLSSLAAGETEKALLVLQKAGDAHANMELFTELLIERVRVILFLRLAPALESTLAKSYSAEELVSLKAFASAKPATIDSRLLSLLLETLPQISQSPIPTLPLELAIMKAGGRT